MKLKVLPTHAKSQPWYHAGLKFTCTQCGNCCTGAPGFVWISDEEVQRLAEFLRLSVDETLEKYCRRIGERLSLKESRNARGEYDCVFLREQPDGKRSCTVYPVRPLQCRTWPFWEGNLTSRKAWDVAARRCPGMGRGKRYTPEQIAKLRDARDWPEEAPTSDGA